MTIVNPKSDFTFLNFLKEEQDMLRFFIYENNFPFRKHYNKYCKWTASRLPSLRFSSKVTNVVYNSTQDIYCVTVLDVKTDRYKIYYARHLVLGIGTEPLLPSCVTEINHPLVFHSSEYLNKKKKLSDVSSVSVVGSGQSAGEIFLDLLQMDSGSHLSWFTRSERFYPMEYTKLSLEMTSLDYIDFFHSLNLKKRGDLIESLNPLYKGINASLIDEIYDTLYLKHLDNPNLPFQLSTNTELRGIEIAGQQIDLDLHHTQFESNFSHQTSALILATGYKPRRPRFLENIRDRIIWQRDNVFQVARNYSIDITGRQIFVQNAELHTHGFSAPDLGMGPYRNATILNSILGYEHFVLEKKIAFQSFGIPSRSNVKEHCDVHAIVL